LPERCRGYKKNRCGDSNVLHGNETSGWAALRQYLSDNPTPRRSLIIFLGNLAAAAESVRSLPGQVDYNRIWKGASGYEGELVAELMAHLQAAKLFAALDIHNNTGRNPHYGVLTSITPQSMGLAYLFSDTAVYMEEPDTVITLAAQTLCPATAIEAGPVGDRQSDLRTFDLLERYMNLDEIPLQARSSLRLHRALARVHVMDNIEFDFADEMDSARLATDDLILTAGMEAVNFHAVPAGTEFAFTRRPLSHTLRVLDPSHRDVTDDFLTEVHGDVSLRRNVIPAM
jgi:hypothetical protein